MPSTPPDSLAYVFVTSTCHHLPLYLCVFLFNIPLSYSILSLFKFGTEFISCHPVAQLDEIPASYASTFSFSFPSILSPLLRLLNSLHIEFINFEIFLTSSILHSFSHSFTFSSFWRVGIKMNDGFGLGIFNGTATIILSYLM